MTENIAALKKPKRKWVVRETFETTVIEGAISGKPYINVPDGKGGFFKFYLGFHAPEGDRVRVTVEKLPRKEGR